MKPEGTRQGWHALDKHLAWVGGQILREQESQRVGRGHRCKLLDEKYWLSLHCISPVDSGPLVEVLYCTVSVKRLLEIAPCAVFLKIYRI